MAEWWGRVLLMPPVLDVRVGDRSPAGGAGLVSVRYRSRLARVTEAACWAVLGGWLVFLGVMVGDEGLRESYDGSVVQPLLIAVVATITVVRSRTRRLFLTDQILGDAAARAAAALGQHGGAGRWKIRGGAAKGIGADLVRLHRLWTPEPQGPGRQQGLWLQAGPEVRTFMSPPVAAPPSADRFAEPDHLGAAPYEPGDAWPSLGSSAADASILPPSPTQG